MKNWIITILCSLILTSPVQAKSKSTYSCESTDSATLYFSNSKVRDKISVSIKGDKCDKATLHLTIKNKQGRILYKYNIAMKTHHVDVAGLERFSDKMVLQLITLNSIGFTNELPVWKNKKDYYENTYQELSISRKYYNYIRTKKWVTYSHKTYYEGWKIITYDRDKQKVVVISTGGI